MPLDVYVDYKAGDGDARVGACTVVGPRDEVESFVEEMKNKGIINDEQIKRLTQ
jgi:hypothetical protein